MEWLSKINLFANATLIKSRVQTSDTLSVSRPLQGQAPYLINVGVYYDTKQYSIAILYNVIGPRIYLVGGSDGPHTPPGSSIGEMPRNTIDLNFKANLSKYVIITLGIQDLLNQRVLLVTDVDNNGKFELKIGDTEFMSYRKGSIFTAGLLVKL